MVNYENGKIYKIVDNTNGNIYIGSTCSSLKHRLVRHEISYKAYINGKYSYVSSFEVIKNGDYSIVLLENCKCDSKEELRSRERYYFDQLECVNKIRPKLFETEAKEVKSEYYKQYYRSNLSLLAERKKQWDMNHKEELQSYRALYYSSNKKRLTELNKQYYQQRKDESKQYYLDNIDRIKKRRSVQCVCQCGGTYSVSNKQQHLRSNKHKKLILKYYEDTMTMINDLQSKHEKIVADNNKKFNEIMQKLNMPKI